MTMLGNNAASLSDLIDPKKPVTIDLLSSSSGDGSSATIPIVSLSDVYGLGVANGNGVGGAARPGGGGGGGSSSPDHWSSSTTGPLIFDVTFDSSVTGSNFKTPIETSIKSVITDY